MELVRPKTDILTPLGVSVLDLIEQAGRTCYKSEKVIGPDTSVPFCENLLKRGHLSVIEHVPATVRFIIDRGVSHELVRHRLCSFSQESTRYCDYNRGHITYIIPPWVQLPPGIYNSEEVTKQGESWGMRFDPQDRIWATQMMEIEKQYKKLREGGWLPERARSVLPNSLKTEVIVTANMREWRHIFTLRCSNKAHPQMREIMRPLLAEFRSLVPVLFDDIETKE